MYAPNGLIPTEMFQIGDQIDQFQIKNLIAQGGMSKIYHAFDLIKKTDVVIKFPDKSLIGDPAQFERFQREIEISQLLSHMAVLKGICTGIYNSIPYLVTEMVKGQTLRHLINTSAPLTVDQTFSLARKIADGMAYCHEHGVVHRDLKPENILITSDDQPVIMDFGLALTKSAHRVTYANLSITMGTPDYMSPEQVEGQRGDARSDIYSLGIILFEMISGAPPFTGDNNLAVLAQHVRNDAPRLDRIRPDISPQTAVIVARCLQRKPDDRFQTMRDLISAIDSPDSQDLSLLERISVPPVEQHFWRSDMIKVIVIAIGILAGIVILAITLQYLK